ncbi:MAG: dihydrofolate reductase [Rhizobiales bacterium]|nr:dihydrofolate reductase [Hyphomicrobiales bacterium]
MQIVFVAAVAENGVIGRDNGMPWRLKSDLRRFRQLTMGRPVLMGRKTFLSIGRPLPGRTNIVVTRDRAFAAAGVVAAGLAEGLAVARADGLRRGADSIMVIGGAEIYAALFAQADRLEIAHVHARPDGDARFPAIDPAVWEDVSRAAFPAGPDDDAAVTAVSYRRRGPR